MNISDYMLPTGPLLDATNLNQINFAVCNKLRYLHTFKVHWTLLLNITQWLAILLLSSLFNYSHFVLFVYEYKIGEVMFRIYFPCVGLDGDWSCKQSKEKGWSRRTVTFKCFYSIRPHTFAYSRLVFSMKLLKIHNLLYTHTHASTRLIKICNTFYIVS